MHTKQLYIYIYKLFFFYEISNYIINYCEFSEFGTVALVKVSYWLVD